MRASRLVSLLLLLQTRGRMTAAELARELEVSERTIYRDVDALSAAGVPIYAERGPLGGVQLVEGYRTRLTGMTAEEAEALFLSGVPGPAAQLGLGTVVAAAQLKVRAALPGELRARASRLIERFHLDTTGWFRPGEEVAHLTAIAQGVWDARRLHLAYDRGDKLVERTVEPLGLVLKGGVWYLVARVEDQIRTYRASRIVSVDSLDETFERPEGFDLVSWWLESTAAYERGQQRLEITIRVDPDHSGWLTWALGEDGMATAERLTDPDPEGWLRLRARVLWPEDAAGRLLALGGAVQVLDPPQLRDELVALARAALLRHGEIPELSAGADARGGRPPDQPAAAAPG
ncbi:MAG TPA: YafY family protein [candidate division Zixibacteria bacterium]|nr:YafY family protein [candidate division Zixibacteria bacterium]